jgi:hypothetical protein
VPYGANANTYHRGFVVAIFAARAAARATPMTSSCVPVPECVIGAGAVVVPVRGARQSGHGTTSVPRSTSRCTPVRDKNNTSLMR